ncbi:MAG TPA: 23S rRNA (uracil(1939)-C(5))-methyltransferase RlmD [Candidatus Hydrogenedentes bacterium]|nr:23S rRNA (uracil(1939)-C(5))-methyltransferase RlmD [Candidatus Hydrogenedentota bacterium]HRT21444.1 23S rRNA (uracil(1939)-C(5))-methyltransferase RlmD [Candidatus Hydrogenedentota bacterium]HRT63952.1 23S rRNA (uracil(1939)-C(5))-methyltransferase RlmD [Candidatus Hydrogenedentota bacterium]
MKFLEADKQDGIGMPEHCPHFGDCGGCKMQEVPYAEQLSHKAALLAALFNAHWPHPIPVEPSPTIWHYRNKVDFSFGRKFYPEPPPKDFDRESVLGFKTKNRWYRPLDVEECRIAPEGMGPLLDGVRRWMLEQGLHAYDTRNKKGFLRALLVREAKRTSERMVVLITADGDFDRSSFVEAVRAVYPAKSIQRGIFRGLADVATAEEVEVLYGPETIEDCLCIRDGDALRPILFRISPFSFFQTNTFGAERLYARIRQWVKDINPDTLYDLYGGMGGIAFACADLVGHIVSVESVASATQDGIYNAKRNGIENVTFFTDTVERYLKNLREGDGFPPDSAVVIDPPRSGLHPKALRHLMQYRPENLLYISCKPQVLAMEMPVLLEAYTLDDLRAVDLFPHTEHVEALAAFTRKD